MPEWIPLGSLFYLCQLSIKKPKKKKEKAGNGGAHWCGRWSLRRTFHRIFWLQGPWGRGWWRARGAEHCSWKMCLFFQSPLLCSPTGPARWLSAGRRGRRRWSDTEWGDRSPWDSMLGQLSHIGAIKCVHQTDQQIKYFIWKQYLPSLIDLSNFQERIKFNKRSSLISAGKKYHSIKNWRDLYSGGLDLKLQLMQIRKTITGL